MNQTQSGQYLLASAASVPSRLRRCQVGSGKDIHWSKEGRNFMLKVTFLANLALGVRELMTKGVSYV